MNPKVPLPFRKLTVVALLASTLAACSVDPRPVAEPVRPALVVEVRASGAQNLSWVGEVRAARRAEPAFAVAGRVASVAVDIGDTVRAGQVLAKLDEEPLRAQKAAAASELARAEALQAEARARLQRQTLAQQAGATSTAETGAAQAEAATAEAAWRAARAQLDLASWQLSQAALRAPLDGVVGVRSLEPGQAAAPGAPAFVIDGAGRELALRVPADLLLQPGQAVTLRQGEHTHASRVLRIATRLDAGGVRQVFVEVPQTAAVGSTWTAEIQSGVRDTALQVPLRAVLPAAEAGRGQVLRLTKDDRTEAVSVSLGRVLGDWVEVPVGLTAGDRIVVAGAVAIAPGTAVKPVAWRAGDRS